MGGVPTPSEMDRILDLPRAMDELKKIEHLDAEFWSTKIEGILGNYRVGDMYHQMNLALTRNNDGYRAVLGEVRIILDLVKTNGPSNAETMNHLHVLWECLSRFVDDQTISTAQYDVRRSHKPLLIMVRLRKDIPNFYEVSKNPDQFIKDHFLKLGLIGSVVRHTMETDGSTDRLVNMGFNVVPSDYVDVLIVWSIFCDVAKHMSKYRLPGYDVTFYGNSTGYRPIFQDVILKITEFVKAPIWQLEDKPFVLRTTSTSTTCFVNSDDMGTTKYKIFHILSIDPASLASTSILDRRGEGGRWTNAKLGRGGRSTNAKLSRGGGGAQDDQPVEYHEFELNNSTRDFVINTMSQCKGNVAMMIYVSSFAMTHVEWGSLYKFLLEIKDAPSIKTKRQISIVHETNQRALPSWAEFHKVVNCYYNQDYDIRRVRSGTHLHALIQVEQNRPSRYDKAQSSYDGATDDVIIGDYTRQFNLSKGLINFSLMSITFNSSPWWWYDYFLRTLQCAQNRFMQLSGTCWFSALLNCLLLTERVRDLVLQQTPPPPKPRGVEGRLGELGELGKIDNPQWPPDQVREQNDTVWLKHVFNFDNASYFRDALVWLIYEKYEGRLRGDEDYLMSFSKILNPIKNEGYFSQWGMLRALYLIFEAPTNAAILAYKETSSKMHHKEAVKVLFHNKDILFIDDLFDSPPQIDGYEMVCACLNSGNHTIAGLFCNGTPYVYDSNNISAITPWNVNLGWEGLGNYYKKNLWEYVKKYSFYTDVMIKYSFVLYMKKVNDVVNMSMKNSQAQGSAITTYDATASYRITSPLVKQIKGSIPSKLRKIEQYTYCKVDILEFLKQEDMLRALYPAHLKLILFYIETPDMCFYREQSGMKFKMNTFSVIDGEACKHKMTNEKKKTRSSDFAIEYKCEPCEDPEPISD